MSDLLKRLRTHADFRMKHADRPEGFKGCPDPSALAMMEAADEIEKLRSIVVWASCHIGWENCGAYDMPIDMRHLYEKTISESALAEKGGVK